MRRCTKPCECDLDRNENREAIDQLTFGIIALRRRYQGPERSPPAIVSRTLSQGILRRTRSEQGQGLVRKDATLRKPTRRGSRQDVERCRGVAKDQGTLGRRRGGVRGGRRVVEAVLPRAGRRRIEWEAAQCARELPGHEGLQGRVLLGRSSSTRGSTPSSGLRLRGPYFIYLLSNDHSRRVVTRIPHMGTSRWIHHVLFVNGLLTSKRRSDGSSRGMQGTMSFESIAHRLTSRVKTDWLFSRTSMSCGTMMGETIESHRSSCLPLQCHLVHIPSPCQRLCHCRGCLTT